MQRSRAGSRTESGRGSPIPTRDYSEERGGGSRGGSANGSANNSQSNLLSGINTSNEVDKEMVLMALSSSSSTASIVFNNMAKNNSSKDDDVEEEEDVLNSNLAIAALALGEDEDDENDTPDSKKANKNSSNSPTKSSFVEPTDSKTTESKTTESKINLPVTTTLATIHSSTNTTANATIPATPHSSGTTPPTNSANSPSNPALYTPPHNTVVLSHINLQRILPNHMINTRLRSSSSSSHTNSPSRLGNKVPSSASIRDFFELIFSKSQLESECIIMALIYIERLMKKTKGRLCLRYNNWKSM